MPFKLEKLFKDVFAPGKGDIVTILHDLPHGKLTDHKEWQERREMALEWHKEMASFANTYGITVKPLISYEATGSQNADIPEYGQSTDGKIRIEDAAAASTIVICMPQYSATAPLMGFAKKYPKLRVASMPMVKRSMQETALSADYSKIARICAKLAPFFKQAQGIEVKFSTGHTCYFDTSNHNAVLEDNGILHPVEGGPLMRLRNLPSGEVAICPNENEDSRTNGEIPVVYDKEVAVFVLKNNQIIDVKGETQTAKAMKQKFADEKALRNIAEVAIGCNDKAVVTGNVLEDEKAGFHWAYGRSEHLGGKTDIKAFSSLDKVCHQDIVYAIGSPVLCAQFDFILPDNKRMTAIKDGKLII
ncbi:hypothetical protein ACFL6Y_09650 [Elusimicrobiota bacterium]